MTVDWAECEDREGRRRRCRLALLDLDSLPQDAKGVYVIWSGTEVVRVGQGDIADRLRDHKQDPKIVSRTAPGRPLYVTWAVIENKKSRDGAERFLFDQLNPLVGTRAPNVLPIRVNLPF